MPAWMLPAALMGTEVLGGLFGMGAQRKNQRAADRRYRDLTGRIDAQMGGLQGPSEWEIMLQRLIGGAKAPTDITAGTYDPAQIDLSQLMTQTPGGLASQDALMQFLRRSPADQLGGAYGTLNELAATGGASNVNSLLDAIIPLQERATSDAAARLNAGVSGLGQRGGSAARLGEARVRSDMGAQNNATNAGIVQQMLEAASGRRLGAAGQLGSLMQGFAGQQLGAAETLGGFDQAMRQMLGGAMGQNVASQNRASEFNIGTGLETARGNQNAQNQFLQMMMQGMGMGAGMMGNRQGQMAQLLGLLSGQQQPMSPTTNPLFESAQMAMLLPMLLGQLRGGGGKKA